MSTNNTIWAEHALTPNGWQQGVSVEIDTHGVISSVKIDQTATGTRVSLLVPAMANLHSHAFQRAMAGLTETRGDDSSDSFWTWRKLMYQFLDRLNPDDVESIAAFVQIEMLESGYVSVGEFHYLHHQPDGSPYDNPAEMLERIVAASIKSGIGLTLLPVMYEQGGCDGSPLGKGQKRFGNTLDEYLRLFNRAEACIAAYAPSAKVGMAPHSLRAVSRDSLSKIADFGNDIPLHIHVAEQMAEVDEVVASYGARPVEWLLEHLPIKENWCLIHATHMTESETHQMAASGAVAGLCPITESNLGDGIFNGLEFKKKNGSIGIGTDSNIYLSLSQELRTLEYTQRLKEKFRAVYAETDRSTARVLYEASLKGGAQALQRKTGCIQSGYVADLLSLDNTAVNMSAISNDAWLDTWVFAGDDRLVADVWCAGAHLVTEGRHVRREPIEQKYRQVVSKLLS